MGLSFNCNLSVLCNKEYLLLKYQARFNPFLGRKLKAGPPLHLTGELEDRFATRSAQYSKKPMAPDFAGALHADTVLAAWNLYYYQDEITTVGTLKRLLLQYGELAAFSKSLWDELLIRFMTPVRLDEIMAQL